MSLTSEIRFKTIDYISQNDLGHQWEHGVEVTALAAVINESFTLWENVNDILVAGLLHDVGLIAGRSKHNEVGVMMLRDGHLKDWFDKLCNKWELNKTEILYAIQEHRASIETEFYSPLSRLVSMADRGEPDIIKVVQRLKDIGHTKEWVIEHCREKYSRKGYIKYDPIYIEYFGERFETFMDDTENEKMISSIYDFPGLYFTNIKSWMDRRKVKK